MAVERWDGELHGIGNTATFVGILRMIARNVPERLFLCGRTETARVRRWGWCTPGRTERGGGATVAPLGFRKTHFFPLGRLSPKSARNPLRHPLLN